MRASVLHPSELTADDQERWRGFQRADEGLRNPFLAPEFAAAVGRARSDARVAVIEDAGEVVAFFAFQVVETGVGEPVGAGICDAQAVVHRGDWRLEVGGLLDAVGLRAWRFDHLLTTQPAFEAFHEQRHPAPRIDLSAGLDAYLTDLRASSSTALAQTRRLGRKLERELGAVEVTWRAADPGALETLAAWKSAQYRRTGTWDRFARPWVRHVVEDLAATSGPWLRGWLSTLHAGGRLAAGHLGLRCDDVLSYWFPVYDPALGGYAPGRVLLLALAEHAAADGVRVLDLGKGAHHYKVRFSNGQVLVAEGTATRSGSR